MWEADMLMLMLALLWGCNTGVAEDPGDPVDKLNDDEEPCLVVAPQPIDFGEIDAMAGDDATVIITLGNECEGTLEVEELFLEDALSAFEVGLISFPMIGAGQIADVSLTYRPTSGGVDQTRLVVRSNDPDEPEVFVSVKGKALAPRAELTPMEVDLGMPRVGCVVEQELLLANTGTTDMDVTEIGVVESSGEYWATHAALPWVLGPGEEWPLSAMYRPVDDVMDVASVYLVTNDPGVPVVSTTLSGSGVHGKRETDSFVFEAGGKVDILFTLDRSYMNSARVSALAGDIPELVETLDDLGADWQIGAVVTQEACILGTADYIDSTNALSAESIFLSMADLSFQAAPYTGWSLRGFTLATNALSTRNSGCNEDMFRSGASLAVVHFSGYDDYSTTAPGTYVTSLQNKVDEVVVHAIAADVPGGCGVGTMAGKDYQTATKLTGGEFLSICDSDDYPSHLREIAEASVGATGRMELLDQAVPGTLVLEVEGNVETTGWDYDEATNSVAFDGSSMPPDGSIVDISYEVVPSDCP